MHPYKKITLFFLGNIYFYNFSDLIVWLCQLSRSGYFYYKHHKRCEVVSHCGDTYTYVQNVCVCVSPSYSDTKFPICLLCVVNHTEKCLPEWFLSMVLLFSEFLSFVPDIFHLTTILGILHVSTEIYSFCRVISSLFLSMAIPVCLSQRMDGWVFLVYRCYEWSS
jgi:hypothetical protein